MPIDWETIEINGVRRDENAHLVGHSVAASAARAGKPAAELYFDVLLSEKLGTSCLMHVGHEENVQAIMRHRTHTGGSDGLLVGARPHPPLVLYAMPLLAGLSITHAFLPPHPGPVAAAGLLHVELGWIILMGLVCGIPAFLVGGVLFSTWIGKRIDVAVPEEFLIAEEEGEKEENPPSLRLVSAIIAIPLVLILAGTFGSIWLPKNSALAGVATFIGTPAVALTISVLLASWLALLVVAISAGSIIASHVNDGGFWIISRYFNLTVPQTLKTWTALETVLSVSGFGVAALLMTVV